MVNHRWSGVLAIVCAAGVAGAEPKVDRRDIGGLTFALPAGWTLAQPAGQDHAALTFNDGTRWCIVSLYRPIASDNYEIDFFREWKAVAGTIKDQKPKPTHRKLGGFDVIEATGSITADDGTPIFERVGVVGGGGQLAALIVLSSNEKTNRACQPDADAMAASIAFAAAPGAPAAPKPAGNALIGTMKSSITAADLAGTWSSGASVVTSYYSTSTGDYRGATASFANMAFTFHANGTYEYTESGMSNGSRFRNTDAGTFTLDGGSVLLKAKNGREQTKQLIAFMDTPDGLAVMTTYPIYPSDHALDAAAIASRCYVKDGMYQCTNGEIWSRAPAKTK